MRLPALLLLVPALGAAQEAAPANAPQAAQIQAGNGSAITLPVISIDQPHFDFGKIYTDSKSVHRFKVTNKGGAALNISRLIPSCGCTSTVIGQWTLEPGQSTEVEATFNPSGFRGAVHKAIQVVSNDPKNPSVNLTFEAEVLREIMPSSDTIFFQDVVRTVPRKSSIKFTSGSGEAFKLLEAKAPGAPWISTAIRPEGSAAWVDVTLDGKLIPSGRSVGTDAVVVKTDSPKAPLVNLTVQWEVRASLVADPVRVAWVDAPGKELRAKVVLKQVDGKPFRILSSRSTSPVIRVEVLTKAASATQEIQVVMTAKAKAGMYNEKVLLATDNPDQPEFELRVAASLR